MQVFLTHLHSDHIADLATFYVGAMFGRTQPWHVWGPSGENATTGTAHSIEGLRQVSTCTLRTTRKRLQPQSEPTLVNDCCSFLSWDMVSS